MLHNITDKPTPWSRVLGMLVVPRLAKKFQAFYGTQRFSTVLKKAATYPSLKADQYSSCPPSFLKTHFNIIPLSTSGSSKWSLSLRFSHQNPVCTSTLPHKHYMPRPSHSSWFAHPNIWWGIHSIKRLLMSSPLSSYLIPLRPKYSPQHPILKHVQPTSLPQCDQVSHPYNTTVLYILISVFLNGKLEDKDSALNDNKHSLTSFCS